MTDSPAGATTTTSNAAETNAANILNTMLEAKTAERHVWLMKLPPVVTRSLLQHQQRQKNGSLDGPVAKVTVSIDLLRPGGDNSTEFTMDLASTESGNVPKSYALDMSTSFIPMSVFCESPQGKISVEGKIYHKFDMKPRCNTIEDYGNLCRERTHKSTTKTRQIQVIDDDSRRRISPMVIPLNNSQNQEKRKIAVKGSETKRTRRGRDEMEEIMFKLFERQPNWALRQLVQETNQPEQFLKDMLKLLCVYNNKGPNQGTYELKPEYKKVEEEPEPKPEPDWN